MPDADRFSIRDHTAIYEAVAAHDPMRAFHEMTSHLRLISQLYRESKRLSEEILRNVTHDVAARIDRENQAMWLGSLGAPRDGKETPPSQPRQAAARCLRSARGSRMSRRSIALYGTSSRSRGDLPARRSALGVVRQRRPAQHPAAGRGGHPRHLFPDPRPQLEHGGAGPARPRHRPQARRLRASPSSAAGPPSDGQFGWNGRRHHRLDRRASRLRAHATPEAPISSPAAPASSCCIRWRRRGRLPGQGRACRRQGREVTDSRS